MERLASGNPVQGSDLGKHALAYLKETTSHLEDATTRGLVSSIRLASAGQTLPLSDSEWVRLADAALTIGSGALDRITRRLSIQAAAAGWSSDFDYRPLATQIHALARPARKIRNAIAHRAKCVRAILKAQQTSDVQSQGYFLAHKIFHGDHEIQEWQEALFELFRTNGSVSERFHSMYFKEWDIFCKEWNAFNFKGQASIEDGLTSIYEKNLGELTREANKFNLQWTQLKPEKIQVAPISNENNSITYDIKRKQDQFTISILVPELTQQKYNKISIDLMDLIESATGLSHVDALRGGKNSDLINIDVYGKYSLDQMKAALSKVETYFQDHN